MDSSKSVRSFFSTAAPHGQLPHIIGSEEYNHDNSCGLIDDLALGPQPLDFGSLAEPSGTSSVATEHDPSYLFRPQMFSMRQDSPWKDGSEPLVSAASDFKAMLEAALLSTYKFYDEESSSTHDVVDDARGTTNSMNQEALSSSQAAANAGAQDLNISETSTISPGEGNQSLVQDTNFDSSEFYSTLVSGSLFDAEEDLPLAQQPTVDEPTNAATGPDALCNVSEEEFIQKARIEDVSALERDTVLEDPSPSKLQAGDESC